MANSFATEKQRRLGGPAGKSFILVEGILTIDTPAASGGVAGQLPASLFKLVKIVSCEAIILSTNLAAYFGVPDYTGDSLCVAGGAAGALQNLPNGSYRVKLLGT